MGQPRLTHGAQRGLVNPALKAAYDEAAIHASLATPMGPLISIARRHNVNRKTVERALDRRGIPHGRAARSPCAEDAKTRYEAGQPASALARLYRVSHGKVTNQLRKQGVHIRNRQQAAQVRRIKTAPPK